MRVHMAVLMCVLLSPAVSVAQVGEPDGRGTDSLSLIAQAPQSSPPPSGPGGAPPRPPVGMGPGGVWWKNTDIAKRIELSDAQVAQIDKIVLDHRLQLVDLRAALDKEELKLQPLLDADRPDEAKVAAQLDQIIAARGKLDKTNAMMMLAIRRVLTPEQWRTLQTIQQERARERGRPGEERPDGRGPQPPPRRGPGEGQPGG